MGIDKIIISDREAQECIEKQRNSLHTISEVSMIHELIYRETFMKFKFQTNIDTLNSFRFSIN